MSKEVKRIVFVCGQNTIRSQMAEALARKEAGEQNRLIFCSARI